MAALPARYSAIPATDCGTSCLCPFICAELSRLGGQSRRVMVQCYGATQVVVANDVGLVPRMSQICRQTDRGNGIERLPPSAFHARASGL